MSYWSLRKKYTANSPVVDTALSHFCLAFESCAFSVVPSALEGLRPEHPRFVAGRRCGCPRGPVVVQGQFCHHLIPCRQKGCPNQNHCHSLTHSERMKSRCHLMMNHHHRVQGRYHDLCGKAK